MDTDERRRRGRQAATHHHRAGRPLHAARALASVDLPGEAAAALEQLPGTSVGTFDPDEHAATVALLDEEAIRDRPALLVHLADTYTLHGRRAEAREVLVRARDVVARRRPADPERLRVIAAALVCGTRDHRSAQTTRAAHELLRSPTLPEDSRGRLLAVLTVTDARTHPRDPLGELDAHDVAAAPGSATIRLEVLGSLCAWREGTLLALEGRTGELLAFLALHEGRTTSEQLIDALWPHCDLPRGRERLRTVLARLRRAAGDVVQREGATLRLGDGIVSDVGEFRRRHHMATRPGAFDAAAARAALEHYGGEAVPALADREWTQQLRRELHQRALRLHDRLARHAELDGRVDEAVQMLLAALTHEPTAEHRYRTAARLQAGRGRLDAGLELLADARQALLAAGHEPSPQLTALEDYLRRRAHRPHLGAA